MNSACGPLVKPISIKIVNDETGEVRLARAQKAADTVVNPFKVKAAQKEVISTATDSLERNFKKRLQNIFGDYETMSAIIIDEVDARQPIQDLYYASNCIPKIVEDTTNQLYELSVSEYNRYQRAYNDDARARAEYARQELGEGAYLCPEQEEDIVGIGGSN